MHAIEEKPVRKLIKKSFKTKIICFLKGTLVFFQSPKSLKAAHKCREIYIKISDSEWIQNIRINFEKFLECIFKDELHRYLCIAFIFNGGQLSALTIHLIDTRMNDTPIMLRVLYKYAQNL